MNALGFKPLPLAEQHRLILENRGLVIHYAKQYAANLSMDDRIGEGMVGLTIAAQRYSPNEQTKFSTYASFWIKSRLLGASSRLAGCAQRNADSRLFFGLRRAIERLTARGQSATDERLAEILRVPERVVAGLRVHVLHGEVSIDQSPTFNDGQEKHIESQVGMISPAHQEHQAVTNSVARARSTAIDEALAKLHPKEAEAVRLRYLSDDPMTLQEIGDLWGVSRERVRQREANGLRKLRKFLQPSLVEIE